MFVYLMQCVCVCVCKYVYIYIYIYIYMQCTCNTFYIEHKYSTDSRQLEELCLDPRQCIQIPQLPEEKWHSVSLIMPSFFYGYYVNNKIIHWYSQQMQNKQRSNEIQIIIFTFSLFLFKPLYMVFKSRHVIR